MAKYLVTGGFGFVGSHLVEKLHTRGDEVTIVDNLSNGYLRNLQHIRNSVIPYLANVENLKSVNLTDRFDGIFHLATAPRSSSLIDPFTDIETNCKGMIAVLEVARSHDAKVVFTSNSGIYGAKNEGDTIDEHHPNNPTTPYDTNKLASEYYCKIYNKLYGVRSAIVRFATVYGERQQVNESLNWRPLVATFAKKMLNNEQVIINGTGEQTRDLIYVKDAADGVLKAMDSSANEADIFLLSTNVETSVNQVLRIVEEILDTKAKVAYSEPLKGDIMRMSTATIKL